MPKWLRSILIVILVLALLGGGTYGILTVLKNRQAGAVNVYPVSDLIMNYSWANQSETEGRVTTDKIQSVYISDTQQVTEVFVTEGQEVKAGDPILAFDTTLSDLELERKRLEIEKLELQIAEAKQRREEMNSYRVWSAPAAEAEPEEEMLVPVKHMPYLRGGDGSAARPYIFLWNDLCAYDDVFINSVLPYLPGVSRPTPPPVQPPAQSPGESQPPSAQPGTEPSPSPSVPVGGTEPSPTPEPSATPEPTATPEPSATPEPTATPGPSATPEPSTTPEPSPTAGPGGEAAPTPSPSPEPEKDPVVYVVFEQREEDALEGMVLRVWQMNFWRAEDNRPVFTLVEPMPGYDAWMDTDKEPAAGSGSGGSYGGGVYYTWSEIQQMKAEADQQIFDLQFQLKKAQLDYEIVEYELTNGMVYSRIDGVVKTLRSAEEALALGEPMVLVSGGGGYYVQALLGELDLDYMHVGDTVSVQSWESGETMEGEIVEISEYPDDGSSYGYYWSQGNSNISKYPFTIFLPEDAPLRENEYVFITFSRQNSDEESMYLENAFLRRENGQSFVYALGEDGLLEKRILQTGGSLWGSNTEILDGLDPETDYLAFPYGRDVKEGAKTEIATMDELYGVYY